MSDYNYRQYVQMLKVLQISKLNTAVLGQITNSLEALLALLEKPDKEWIEQFQSEWGTLEQVYSFSVMEGRKSLNKEEIEWVTQTLENLKKLIQLKLEIRGDASTEQNSG